MVILGGAFPGPAVCYRCKARAAQMVRSGETGREERTSLQALKYIFLRELMLITGEEKSAFHSFTFSPLFLVISCSREGRGSPGERQKWWRAWVGHD